MSAVEPPCNHDDDACDVQHMTVCECGAVYGDNEWIYDPADEVEVWTVHRADQFDGIYLFASQERADQYAAHYEGADVQRQTVMNDSAAGQFIIDSVGEEEE